MEWQLPVLFVLGLIVGSFLTSFTFSITQKNFSWQTLWRKSFCPHCHKTISWQDNIPLLSFFLLGGRCRWCSKKISPRYPLIEVTVAAVFVLAFWRADFVSYPLPYFLVIAAGLIALAVVDIEHQIIPDEIVLPFLIFNFSFLILLSPSPTLFTHFFWAAVGSLFLLTIHFVTRGRGMGLGDVKLAFLIGLLVGGATWLVFFLAFVAGAVVGLFLLGVKLAKFGKPIPFGPFLIAGAFLTLLFEQEIVMLLNLI